jgi:hypothetical protein
MLKSLISSELHKKDMKVSGSLKALKHYMWLTYFGVKRKVVKRTLTRSAESIIVGNVIF